MENENRRATRASTPAKAAGHRRDVPTETESSGRTVSQPPQRPRTESCVIRSIPATLEGKPIRVVLPFPQRYSCPVQGPIRKAASFTTSIVLDSQHKSPTNPIVLVPERVWVKDNVRIMENIIRISKECQFLGAKGVIFQMRPWVMLDMLAGVEQNFATELSQQLVSPESIAMRNSVTIPVCFVKQDVFEKLFLKPLLFSLIFEFTGEIQEFDRGIAVIIVPLSTQLEKCLENGGSSESSFALISSSSRTDQEKCFLVLHRCTTVVNFPLTISLALELNDGKGRPSRSYQELFAYVAHDILKTYTWSPECIALLSDPIIRQKFGDWVENVLSNRTVGGTCVSVDILIAFTHLADVSGIKRREDTWDLILPQSTLNPGFPQELFLRCLQSLREMGSPLNPSEKLKLFPLISQTGRKLKMSDIDQAFCLRDLNAVDALDAKLAHLIIAQQFDAVSSAVDLVQCYRSVNSYFAIALWKSVIKPEVSRHLIGFSPTEWIVWLRSSPFDDLNIPILDETFYRQLASNATRHPLSDYITLFSFLKEGADPRYDDSRFVSFLRSRQNKESDAWNSLNSLVLESNNPFVLSLHEVVLGTANSLELTIPSNRARWQCHIILLSSFGALDKCSALTNDLMDLAVTKLFAGCQPTDDAEELLKAFSNSFNEIEIQFVDACVQKCFLKFNIQDNCKDILALSSFVSRFASISKFEHSLFWRCIVTQQKLIKKYLKGNVVISQISDCFLNVNAVTEYDAQNLRSIDAQLEKLGRFSEISLPTMKFVRTVQSTLQNLEDAMELIQSNLPFLRSLNAFVPALIEPFRKNLWFDDHALLNTAPAPAVNQWADELKIVKRFFQTDDCRFFDHFVTNISSRISRRSVLFQDYLVHSRPEEGWRTMESFVSSLRFVEKTFARMLSIEKPPLKFDELMTLGSSLQREARTVEEEIQVLSEFYSNKHVSMNVINDLAVVLDLFHLRDPMKALVEDDGLLSHCGCLGPLSEKQDPVYQQLWQLCHELDDSSIASLWTPDKCREKRDEILRLMNVPDSNSLLNIISLFEQISEASKLCEFFLHRPTYISKLDEGYSAEFRDKVEDFLSQLGGEEYKILDAFKTVSSWIVGVMVVQNSDFMSFVARLTSSPRLAPKFSQTQEEKPFLQIKSVEDNMDYINELFQKGLGSLDSVIGQLRSIDLGCAYVFDLEKGHILINLEEGGRQRTMKNDEVRDLFQRLGFIQFEEKAIAANVQNHIAKLSLFMKSLVEMTELHRLGHPQWTQTTVEVVYGMFPRTLGTQLNFDELTFLSALLAEWKAKIDEIARTTPMMSLLSLSTAQRFADMILNGDVTGALQILCYVQPGFAGSIQDLEKNIQDINNSSPSDWLDVLSKFGSKYCPKKCELTLPSRALSNLSPARYASPPSQLSLLSIMAGIFKNSRPMPAQILWCESSTTASNLESFLRRATLHPTKAFVLLSIEKLEFNQQSILLQTFSSKTNYSNVHLVESGPSIFQSSSWIPVLLFDEFVIEVNCLDILRDWSLSGNCMDHENSVLVTGPPGSGKSYQISKILRSKLENAAGPLVISVFEGFSLRSILMELFERFRTDLSSQFNCSIVIQLNLGKFKLSLKNQWTELMNRVNRFLFELLVLHCMEDPASGLLVSLPINLQCQVLVEVPDISGHLESSAGESMMDYLPALAVISNRIDATSQSFDVSAETRHVTKYLLAFENGSIDHLYGTKSGSSGPKDVIIVLDNSGSMGGGKLETCVRCIQSDIFQSRITPNDKLGLIVFDHAINVHTPFRLFDHDHRAHVTSSLNAARANGGTNMWTALKTAICQLQREGRDNKWIVALTDGDSDDNNVAGKVSTLLTTQASSVRMLFITVGLGAPQEALIRQNCIRNAEQGDALVRADQSAQSIADAWKEVGERLTVSQRIEKEGENISDAESNRLLRKYMKLDERNKHWSRLHQRFWINYMYRRCGILASSERFNKNNDLPGFGGFTMSVMLGEVERALDSDFSVDWSSAHHEQMVYVKSEKEGNDDYVWSVLCSDPDNTSPDWRARKQLLVKLQLTIPTKVDLNRDDRKVLDSYLATGLGIPLENSRAMRSSTGANFDFPMGSLSIIDDHKFVLTLDFVMKLLIMNERIECGIPCIMEGETGVSKTALTRMLFILKNQRNKQSSLASFIRKIYNNHLQQSYDIRLLSVLRALVDHWSLGENSAVAAALNDTPTLALALSIAKTDLWDILREEMIRDPSLDPLCERENCIRSLAQVGGGEKIVDLLLWFVGTVVSRKSNADIDWTFYPINVHAALTAQEIRECVDEAVGRLLRIDTLSNLLDAPSLRNIKMCMFFDEINTSSCMGLLKEIIVDRAMFGRPLPSNLVVIAACNPYREKFISNDRRSELGAEWVIGHYQVHPLPASLQQMSWDYGSLKPAQEKEFISKRLLYVRDQANLTKEERPIYTRTSFSRLTS